MPASLSACRGSGPPMLLCNTNPPPPHHHHLVRLQITQGTSPFASPEQQGLVGQATGRPVNACAFVELKRDTKAALILAMQHFQPSMRLQSTTMLVPLLGGALCHAAGGGDGV